MNRISPKPLLSVVLVPASGIHGSSRLNSLVYCAKIYLSVLFLRNDQPAIVDIDRELALLYNQIE